MASIHEEVLSKHRADDENETGKVASAMELMQRIQKAQASGDETDLLSTIPLNLNTIEITMLGHSLVQTLSTIRKILMDDEMKKKVDEAEYMTKFMVLRGIEGKLSLALTKLSETLAQE